MMTCRAKYLAWVVLQDGSAQPATTNTKGFRTYAPGELAIHPDMGQHKPKNPGQWGFVAVQRAASPSERSLSLHPSQAAWILDSSNFKNKSTPKNTPGELGDSIKSAANARDVPYQSLIKVWLQEKVTPQ